MTSTFAPTEGTPFENPVVRQAEKPAAKPAPAQKPAQRGAPFKPAPPPAEAPPQQPVAPLEPPNPVLQAHGYNGGINGFNQRVQNVVDSYQKAYGTQPPPGLVFDVARSQVQDGQFPQLFTVPLLQHAAKAQQAANLIPPSEQIVVRHDGYAEQNNPIRQATPPAILSKYQQLQKQHPWVAMGMLPLPGKQLSSFWNAVEFANSHATAAQPLQVGGESLQQFQQENALGESLTASRPGENPGLVTAGYGHPVSTDNLKAASFVAAREQVARGVTSVKQAQDKLKQLAPDFFNTLPSTGFINEDWQKAIGKYQTSAQYFRQQTVQLAQDNHFGSNTAAFVAAWKAKQEAIKKNPFLAVFLQHQPLAMFDTKTNGAAGRNLVFGNTKGWGWANVPNWGLASLGHVAGLVLDEVAGTVDQAKTDASYVTSYMQAIMPKNQSLFGYGRDTIGPGVKAPMGKGMTEKQARERAAKVLTENPNWVRVFDPDYTGKGDQKILGAIANTGIDLWLGAPKFTGETVAAGDLGALKASRYFNAKTEMAFNALKAGDLGGATASLEGGLGAERLNALLEEAVKKDEVSLPEYQQRAAELFANGKATVGDAEVNGAIFRSLRTKDLPTKGRVGSAAEDLHAKVTALMDQWENTLRARKQEGVTSHAANFVTSVRQITARAAPGAERRYIFDEKLPQDVYNWARVNLKDQKTAATLRDDLIRLRANDDIQGIADFNDRLRQLYAKAHPDSDLARTPLDTKGPELESESRSFLSFPHEIETRAQRINATLNKLGRAHREIIVGGSPIPFFPVPGFGESLAWKHAVADTTRRIVGGGGILKVDDTAKSLVGDFLKENPEAVRTVGVARSAAKMGENRWITGFRPTDIHSFNTGDFLNDDERLKAAGGYLRHNLTSKALKAFQQSTADDVSPLIDLVQTDKEFQALLFKDARTFTPSTEWQAIPDGLALPTGGEIREVNNVRQIRWAADQVPAPIRFGGLTATEAAQALFRRYKEIEDAGTKAGVDDPLNAALAVLVKNVGPKADAKLGQWIKQNGLAFPVRDGVVERKQWDEVMQAWIGTLMTANKWNRGRLFDHVFYGTVQDLHRAGWDVGDAIPVAADLAKAQTVYHMLDFSNMLQVEQNLRWLSYFATKHRLYWTWILRQAVRRPGLTAAVADIKDHLDNSGNLNLTLFGHPVYVPAARLFWVNATEYPQTSPPVQFLAEAGKGLAEGRGANALADAMGSLTSTSGNVLTRDDQAEMLAIKLALISSGKLQPSAAAVTEGMTPSQARSFDAAVNGYAAGFRMEHGDWPTESDAVKHVLLHETARQFWSTNLFLPVLWNGSGQETAKVKSELAAYGRIASPAKKTAYLDTHPEVALHFGVTQDPAVYLHNNRLWDKFNAAYKQVEQQRTQLLNGILAAGRFTADDSKKISALSQAWSAKLDQLKLEDAATWQGNSEYPAGKISDGKVVTAGPWGTALAGDPFASRAFIHQSFPGIAKGQLNSHTVGERIVELQGEAARLRAAKTPKQIAALGYPDAEAVKTRLSEINQTLSPFFAYPKNAPAQIQNAYYDKYVVPYQKERDAKTNAVALAPEDQQDALRSELRAWKDEHDHPVKLSIGGKPVFSGEGPQFYEQAFQRNKQFAKSAAVAPGAKGPYQTPLSKEQEQRFEQWVKANKIPFDVNARTVDYDMRGFWLAHGTRAANGHFADEFKTPYDTTFSRESKYATKDNPFVWSKNGVLVDSRTGNVVFAKGKNAVTITFPSVVQIGWSRLPDAQRKLGLQQAVVGDWAHIASYEKTMLGVKTTAAVSQGWSLYATTVRDYTKDPSHPSLVAQQRTAIAKQIDRVYPGFYKDYLFAQQPKLDRFMATSLYRQMPKDFYSTVVQPAQEFIRAIKQNGHRTYYEKAWRNAVETQLMPYIDQDPQLKAALAPYGPNFLNTLVSVSG